MLDSTEEMVKARDNAHAVILEHSPPLRRFQHVQSVLAGSMVALKL